MAVREAIRAATATDSRTTADSADRTPASAHRRETADHHRAAEFSTALMIFRTHSRQPRMTFHSRERGKHES